MAAFWDERRLAVAHECPVDVLEEGVHFDFLCTSLGTQPPGGIPYQQLADDVLHTNQPSKGKPGQAYRPLHPGDLQKPYLSSTGAQTAGMRLLQAVSSVELDGSQAAAAVDLWCAGRVCNYAEAHLTLWTDHGLGGKHERALEDVFEGAVPFASPAAPERRVTSTSLLNLQLRLLPSCLAGDGLAATASSP